MSIIGIDGMTREEVNEQIKNGGKFVIFHYCFSIILMTFRRSSNIYFVKPNGKPNGIKYTLLTLLFGWWGIPWGPVHSIKSLAKNIRGGTDVTDKVISMLNENSEVNA